MNARAKNPANTRAASEAQQLKACLEFLESHPAVGWVKRMNVGGFYDKRGQYVKVGFSGCSDIIGQLKDGRFLAFEVKRTDRQLPTPQQRRFLDTVAHFDGAANWGTVDECVHWARTFK